MKKYLCLLIIAVCFSSCPLPFEVLAKMSNDELIRLHTRGVSRAVVTIGIVKNGEMSFTVYGENGRVLPSIEHTYEIGSITKPLTGQLIARAISENRISIDDQIDSILNLPDKDYYPTIRRLMTHQSGYRMCYYNDFISTDFTGFAGNSLYYGVTRAMVLKQVGSLNLTNRDYTWLYSNFGFAVTALVLEEIYNEDFTSLLNSYLKGLELNNTRVNDGRGLLSNNYMRINSGNPYIAAGALVSTITDMMMFAQMQIDGKPSYVDLAHCTWAQVNPGIWEQWLPDPELGFGIGINAMGSGWFIDGVNNIIWHSGNTAINHSYLGFDKTRGIAVVVLSNVSSDRVGAEMLGSTILRRMQ